MLVVRSVVVGPFQENCYLAACERTGEAVLVDPGDEAPRLLALREPGGFRVTRIFATHGHIDHVTAGEEVRRATGAPFSIHADDEAWLAALPKQAEMFGFPPVTVPTVDLRHAGGDTVKVGDHLGQVLHTPGHTRGGTCLWFPEDRVVFTGDTLFSGSVGRTDLPGGDFDALRASIVERLFTLGDDVRFLPGHGPGGRMGDERLSNPFVGEKPRRGKFV
jgi:glyoxylase-like metal-dependent hydrolase (beta-lactamase superfamily II)